MRRETDLAGCRILVLGAGALHEPAFISWARLGCEVVLVDGAAWAHYESLVDSYHPWEVRDAYQPDLARLCGLAEACDVVLTLFDDAQITASAVAERTGHKGASVAAARFARDKHRQRAAAGAHGLRAVGCREVKCPDDATWVAAELPRPWIVKPADAGGSASVRKADSVEALAEGIQQATAMSSAGRCVVEEFVPGEEWSVEALVDGGRLIECFYTAKTLVGDDCFLERRHIVGATPPERDASAITDTVIRMVRMYGVQAALCHAEVRVHDGSATPIEMAVRPAGDGIVDLVRRVHGRNLYVDLVRVLAGLPPAPAAPPLARYAGVEFLTCRGTVTGTPMAAATLRGAPLVTHIVPLARPGTTIDTLNGNWARAGYAVGQGDDAAELCQDLSTATTAMAEAMGVQRS